MSGIATGTALMIGTGVAAGGSLAGAALSSNAAGNAANAQSSAANHAADLQYQASQNALNFQRDQWNQQQSNIAPWVEGGKTGLSQLEYMLGLGNRGNYQQAGAGSPQSGAMMMQSGPRGGAPVGTPAMGTGGLQAPGSGMQPITGIRPVAMNGATSNAQQAGIGSFNPNTPVQPPGGGQMVAPLGQQPASGAMPMTGLQAGGVQNPSGGSGSMPGIQAGGPQSVTSGSPAMMAPVQAGGGTYDQPYSGGMNFGAADGSGPSGVNTDLGGFGSLMQGYDKQFQPPTDITEQNDPGYQARLKLGTDALQRSAAARGNVLTGGTAQALNQGAQDYASNEYGNVYNRAFNQYAQGYNQFEQNQTNQYNRLASLAGLGQQSAAQLGMLGQQASNNVSSNLLGTAANMGQDYQNAGAANASGYVGSANAWGGALGNTGNSLQQLMMLNQLQGGGAGYGYGSLTNLGYGNNGAMTLAGVG